MFFIGRCSGIRALGRYQPQRVISRRKSYQAGTAASPCARAATVIINLNRHESMARRCAFVVDTGATD